MIVIGVDPGLTGAFAALRADGELVDVRDIPTFMVRVGKKNRKRYDEDALAAIVRDLIGDETAFAVVEEQQGFPGKPKTEKCKRCGEPYEVRVSQGVASTMSVGRGMGIWQGLFAAMGVSKAYVRPQIWKRQMLVGFDKADKKSSLVVARRRYPNADLGKAKHHGRAEAILIALYGLMELVPRPVADETTAQGGCGEQVQGVAS